MKTGRAYVFYKRVFQKDFCTSFYSRKALKCKNITGYIYNNKNSYGDACRTLLSLEFLFSQKGHFIRSSKNVSSLSLREGDITGAAVTSREKEALQFIEKLLMFFLPSSPSLCIGPMLEGFSCAFTLPTTSFFSELDRESSMFSSVHFQSLNLSFCFNYNLPAQKKFFFKSFQMLL